VILVVVFVFLEAAQLIERHLLGVVKEQFFLGASAKVGEDEGDL